MKKFLIKTIIIVFPVFTFLVAVNYFGDAANLFNRDYEKKIARIILNGNYVTNISNYDERLVQEELIKNLKYTPDIVVIGSSRAMLINNEYFPNNKVNKVMNNSVSAATLEDLTAIYQIYKNFNKLLEKMVIGIDPWTFQVINSDKRSRWKSIGKYYNQFHNQREENNAFAYDQLLSLSYFQNSFKNLPKIINGNNEPISTKKKNNRSLTKLNDGSIVYGRERRNISVNSVNRSAQVWISNRMIERYKNFKSIQPKWAEFESLVYDMKSNGIEIQIILTPFYPLVFQEMTGQFPIINEIEQRIKIFTEKNKILLYGSFNPHNFELKNDDFYDETHPKESAMLEIFKPY